MATIETTLHNGGEAVQFPMKSFDGMTRVATDSIPDPSKPPFAAAFPKSAEVVVKYDASSPYGAFRVRDETTPKGLVDQSFIEGSTGRPGPVDKSARRVRRYAPPV